VAGESSGRRLSCPGHSVTPHFVAVPHAGAALLSMQATAGHCMRLTWQCMHEDSSSNLNTLTRTDMHTLSHREPWEGCGLQPFIWDSGPGRSPVMREQEAFEVLHLCQLWQ